VSELDGSESAMQPNRDLQFRTLHYQCLSRSCTLYSKLSYNFHIVRCVPCHSHDVPNPTATRNGGSIESSTRQPRAFPHKRSVPIKLRAPVACTEVRAPLAFRPSIKATDSESYSTRYNALPAPLLRPGARSIRFHHFGLCSN
jgi:hypothetical protein